MFKKDVEKEHTQLLYEYLTDEQIKFYEATGYIWVIGQDRSVYQIRDGHTVYVFCDGRAVEARHVYAHLICPDYWTQPLSLLTQLMFLTSNDARFMLDRGCGERTYLPSDEGCPPMKGYKALKGVAA